MNYNLFIIVICFCSTGARGVCFRAVFIEHDSEAATVDLHGREKGKFIFH